MSVSFLISKYKYILFFLSLISSLVAIIFSHKDFIQKQKLLREGSFKGVLFVDSEVTVDRYSYKFFAHDLVSGVRYKVTTPASHEIVFGHCIDVSGHVSIPKDIDSKDVLYTFPYKKYLAKDDIFLLLQADTASETQVGCPKLGLYERLEFFFMKQKKRFTDMLLREYEQPYAGLVAGVLIAGKGLMSSPLLDLFKRVSLSHVVVLSGSNVSLILGCVKTITDKIFRRRKLLQKICIALFIWFFMLLVGGGAPIYRAVASTFCGLFLFSEKTSQVYALAIAIFLLTTISPFQTLYDPSFHLTCCATFGLILFSKFFTERLKFSFLHFLPMWLLEIIAVTLSTQVFVFPYLLYMSGSFSTVFLLSNVLILPLIPFVMFLGFVTIIFSACSFDILKNITVLLNNKILEFIFFIVKKLSQFEYSYIYMKTSTVVAVLVLYFLCLVFIIRIFSQQPPSSNY